MGYRSAIGAGFNPRQIPTQPSRLDNAPRGLILSVVPALGFTNLVTLGAAPFISGSPLLVSSPSGPMMNPNAGYLAFPLAAPQIFSTEVLVQTAAASPSGTVASWQDGTSPGGTYDRSLEAWAGFWTEYIFAGGAQRPTGSAVVAGVITHVVGLYDGTNLQVYVNGVLTVSSVTSSPFSGYGNPNLLIGTGGDGAWNGKIGLVNCANVAWTANEIAQRAAEPFAMFRPLVRRQYYTQSGAAPPAVSLDMWHQPASQPYRVRAEMIPY